MEAGDREDRREHMWLVEGGGPAARKEGAGGGAARQALMDSDALQSQLVKCHQPENPALV